MSHSDSTEAFKRKRYECIMMHAFKKLTKNNFVAGASKTGIKIQNFRKYPTLKKHYHTKRN